MLKRSVFAFSSGVMLMECLFTITISGILFICISRVYPQLINGLTHSYHQYRLDIYLRERLVVLETELRRIGYCKSGCIDKKQASLIQPSALKIGAYPHQPNGSCITFIYDINNNGRWDLSSAKESDYFGYRLRNEQLEQQRGVKDCSSVGWQRFFESNEVRVTEFLLKPYSRLHSITGEQLFYLSVSLKFELTEVPEVKSDYQTIIFLRNVSYL
ncbi:prepilin peptidase-dependent protein [Proteus hauseri]|uniref:prepilin peptidase-dependent protein n=1 Tax=Proteus hauseri TaxID=183417 RepID=UPI0032DA115F